MLTQAELKSQLHYNPETGIFTWLASTNRRIKIGDKVGSKDGDGYLKTSLNYKTYRLHRLAWLYVYGEFPESVIDHINGIKDANCILNLREASMSENRVNAGSQINNTSGFKGVTFHKPSNKWQAQAGLNGKNHYLGLFTTPELASESYKHFATKHHGEFYNV